MENPLSKASNSSSSLPASLATPSSALTPSSHLNVPLGAVAFRHITSAAGGTSTSSTSPDKNPNPPAAFRFDGPLSQGYLQSIITPETPGSSSSNNPRTSFTREPVIPTDTLNDLKEVALANSNSNTTTTTTSQSNPDLMNTEVISISTNQVAETTNEPDTSTALNVIPGPKSGQTYVDITEYLNMPQSEAAKKLGVPTSTLSKRWKEAVRGRKWPYRMVCKLDKEIMTLLHNIPQGPGAPPLPEDVEATLGLLIRKRSEELKPVVVRI